VRKSLVLLKNEDRLLPVRPDTHVLVAGDGAHNIGKQSGGWTLSWQGSGNLNEHFPNGTSIFEGLKEVIEAGGGKAVLSADGIYSEVPDVAIVVFGEDPYAEYQGDLSSVDYIPDDGLKMLRKFRAARIPTISVFLSGRPLWVNPEINASNAFVAAWLPGSEGGGIADVLVGDAQGAPRYDFHGRLSFSWPRTAVDEEVNVGDEDYNPLFAYGYGLGYADDGALATLSEDSRISEEMMITKGLVIEFGDPAGTWRMLAFDEAGFNWVGNSRGASGTGAVRVMPADRNVQEDTIIATWTGFGALVVSGPAANFSEETKADMALRLEYQVQNLADSEVQIGMGRGTGKSAFVDVTESLLTQSGAGWQTGFIKLSCFEDSGLDMASVSEPLIITAGAGFVLQLASAEVVANTADAGCAL
jgi:beta-glucosidase